VTAFSPAERLVVHLAASVGQAAAHEALDVLLANLTTTELAGLEHHWPFWRRPAQEIAPGFASHGFLGGRGAGKTTPCARYVVAEAEANPGMRIALVAPIEDDARRVMIEGRSGLLVASPPWFPAVYEPGVVGGRVTWPNGSQAFQYGAEAPDRFRGPEHHLAWCTEVGAWAQRSAETAWNNLGMGLRLGRAELLWDSSPKTVPLVAKLIARSKAEPNVHRIVRSRMVHNWANLPIRYVVEKYAEFGGTRIGAQELDGEYLEDVEGALFQLAWIVEHRRHAPESWARRCVSVDPAITERDERRDSTGIMCGGIDTSGQVYITRDQTGKHSPERWGSIVIDAYLADRCDCVIVERNRGGDLVTSNLRACAKERGIAVKLLDDCARPVPHDPRTLYVREVHARRGKAERGEPVSVRYEKGKVSHLIGADLATLEEQLTTWTPTMRKSPDRFDACVHLVWELAGLGREVKAEVRTEDVAAVAKAIAVPYAAGGDIQRLLGRTEWGSSI
jgi:phage terminase large subunit-like protein